MAKWYATEGCKGHDVGCGVEVPMRDGKVEEVRKKKKKRRRRTTHVLKCLINKPGNMKTLPSSLSGLVFEPLASPDQARQRALRM